MGRKKYNWKARNNIEVIIDNSATKKIPINIIHREDNFDSCNALVLPNEKRKTKKKVKNTITTRLLSKKRRKQLEKVIEKKKKKLQRTELLKELAKVQASPEELKQYISLTSVQTKGLKRHFREAELSVKECKIDSNIKNENDTIEMPINAIKVSKKKRLAILEKEVIKKTISNLNVIGFDESSNSELESDTKNNEDEQEEGATNIIFLEKDKIKGKNEHISNKKNDLTDGNVTKNTIEEEKKSVTLIKKSLKPQQLIEKKSALFVMLQRKPEIQAARLKLPVVAEEQVIMEIINENPVVIITGETGSGKTTQVPQFLYEAGYAQEKLIGITEPRRVAAISMSKRVAQEMNLTEKEISYLIRFEGNVTPETKIKFMTDGVLLKEIQNDFLLTKYSIIILDEAHERSVYTDILIGLLSRIVPLRNKRKNSLKLVIMSATLHVEEFVENNKLFKMKPPILTVESRQFPVTIHFNKTTSINYISDALKKAIKIHTRLPDGGILIFLTGQREVNFVVRKLRQAFSTKNKKKITKKIKKSENKDFSKEKEDIQDKNDNNENDNIDSDNDFCYKKAIHYNKLYQKNQIQLPNINLDNYSVSSIPIDDTYEDLITAEDDEEEQLNENEDESEEEDIINPKICINAQPLWVLPLYSLLPSHKQARVFEPPPEGHRLCVVSTNVAETSLTIPNIKYVIDCGRCKMRMYDKVTGVSTYKVCYTSKASANQRAGRAGRTGPGHCYRLYSSAVFNNHFEQFSQSEIQRKPVDDLILQMKVMNIDKVVNFPFPTPPDVTQLKMAEKRLIILGILEQPAIEKEDLYSAKVTLLGRSIAAFPVAPRYGKMLALSHQHNLLQYTVCMVAALSVQEILMETFDIDVDSRNKWLQIKRFWAGTGNSLLLGDLMVLIRAVGSAEYAGTKGKLFSFCEEHGLRHKAIVEIRKLRQQLTNEINLNIQDLNLIIDPQMKPPVDMEAKLLRQIVLAGMADQVARKVMPDEINEDQDKAKWKYAYKTVDMEEPVFLHSSCVLRKICPEWVVYQEIYETNKMYMRGVTAIESEWLPKFAPSLCQLGDPLTNPPPRYDPESGKIMCSITGTFGKAGWKLPIMDMEYPLSIDGVKWFACFFLEGKVFPKLKQFVSSLLSTPQSITKAWAKLIPRTQEMTQLLLSHGIMSKVQLLETWKADRNSWNVLNNEERSALDAIEESCSLCEDQRCRKTVGYGGSPDESGETTLDALIMDGVTMDVGGVGLLRNVKNAISVARKVLHNTKHSLIGGELATKFAVEMGFKKESLQTEESKKMWLDWKTKKCQPNFWKNVNPDPTKSCGPYRSKDFMDNNLEEHLSYVTEENHDTIGVIAIDSNGHIAAGTSTNGARNKIPGRIGDSPIAGAGAYADQDVGAAAGTGEGDIMMRFLPSFLAVEEMRRDATPTAAATTAISRIAKHYPTFTGAVIALNKHGEYGAACNGITRFAYYVANPELGKPTIHYATCIDAKYQVFNAKNIK